MQLTNLALLASTLFAAGISAVPTPAEIFKRDDACTDYDAGSVATCKCYSSGLNWSQLDSDNNKIRAAAQSWCATFGDATFAPGIEAKTCVTYGTGFIEFRMKNGASTSEFLDATDCWNNLYQFIVTCPKGGYDDTAVGWRGRWAYCILTL